MNRCLENYKGHLIFINKVGKKIFYTSSKELLDKNGHVINYSFTSQKIVKVKQYIDEIKKEKL